MHGRKENNSEVTQESAKIRTQKQTKKRKSIETVRGIVKMAVGANKVEIEVEEAIIFEV